MITFLALAHMLNATHNWYVPWTCTHVECHANGLRCGGVDIVICTCTYVECSAHGLGWGWGQGSTYRTKNNKCRSFPPTVPLHTYTRVLPTTWLLMMFVHYPPLPQITSSDTYTCVSTNHIFSWNLFLGAVDRESFQSTGTLHARRVLLEKTHGIWKGFCDARLSWKKIWNPGAVGRGSYEFTVTRSQDAFYLRKHKESGGIGTARVFHWKAQRLLRGLAEWHIKFTVKMKPRRMLHEKFSGVGGSGI